MDRRVRDGRRKLFELYYADQITPDSFHAKDVRLNNQLEALQGQREPEPTNDSVDQFDRVVAMLAELDWDVIWKAAADTERRTLLDEFLVRLDVYPDHLDVDIRGAGKLNVALHEAGLRNKTVENTGVGGPTRTPPALSQMLPRSVVADLFGSVLIAEPVTGSRLRSRPAVWPGGTPCCSVPTSSRGSCVTSLGQSTAT